MFDFLNKKIQIRIPLWLLFTIPLLVYAAWEYYWYTKVGLRIVKWHTHLAVFAYIWVAGMFVFQGLFRKSKSERAKSLFLVFNSVIVSFGLMEAFLEVSGLYKTYLEKVSGFYDSPYSPQDFTHYHGWTPNKPHYITKPEYSYWRPTNSHGLADIEWEKNKKPRQKRLLTLGDSFTEGDGAPFDSTYPSLLNRKLLALGDTFYTMNAGVCGSDPFNNFIFLKDKLLRYQPDMIIQVLSSSDLTTDIILRGGMERFQTDGTQKFRPAPWWEPIYAVSYISRIFFKAAGYTELLRQGNITASEEKWLNQTILDLFRQYADLCNKNGIRLYVILRPDRTEIEGNAYAYNFSFILEQLKQNKIQVLDLLEPYRNYIRRNNSTPEEYFWKVDGHHNATGYEMMAQTIYENLSPLLMDSATTIPN